MAQKKVGKQTIAFQNPPSIISTASIVGPNEGNGPMGQFYDLIIEDEMWGEKSWEKAESKLQKETFLKIVEKSGKPMDQIDCVVAGDLLNQNIAANFSMKTYGIPFVGVYGACSTMAESLCVGSMMIEGGFMDGVVCMTSSHFCSAEKQFRYPLELGTVRAESSQWTVTGAGGVMLHAQGNGPFVTHVTIGKIVDMGIKDANNMGAAMAPCAADTIMRHCKDTGFSPEEYDLIITGDLGLVGRELCRDILRSYQMEPKSNFADCGCMVYDLEKQNVKSGASGCACSAVTLAGFIYDGLLKEKFQTILFVATGALFSPTTVQQGESIPCIAHAVRIQRWLK